jgi:hypothetical protein
MYTKILMTSSAAFLAFLGVLLTFVAEESLAQFRVELAPLLTLFLQLMGGLYFGFAILNWMRRDAQIGGIYNKPLVAANLMHFGIGAFALIKFDFSNQVMKEVVIMMACLYVVFAVGFGAVFITNPIKQQNEN